MEYGSYDNRPYSPPPATNTRRPDYPHRSSSTSRSQSGEIEQVVTKLLRTTKALLEALTQWSQLRASTTEILDFRDTLERQFISVSQAFEDCEVPMNDLAWIPHQLKESIAVAMSQEPSPATLEQHLPKIREVIVHLLHGLKGKQHQLRERDTAWTMSSSRDSIRSTDSWRREVPQAALARGASMAQAPPRSAYSSGRSPPPSNVRLTSSDYDPRMGDMPRPSVSTEGSPRMNYSSRPYSPTYGGPAPPLPTQQQPPHMPSPSRSTSSSVGGDRPNSSSSARANPYLAPAPSSPSLMHTSQSRQQTTPPPPPPPPPPPSAPPMVSLPRGDNANDFDESDPGTASALAALKRQENLARRSSVRRASMFRTNGANDYHPMKRPGNELLPPVPAVPGADTRKLGTVDESQIDEADETSNVDEGKRKETKGLSLFLQIGKEVKNVYYEGEISIPALRMLFIEKFNYSSGLNDFPSIYIREPSIGVSYELENLDEVKSKAVLSLNVDDKSEPDQKQIMQQISELVGKEMGEIRKMFVEQIDDLKKQVTEIQVTAQAAPAPLPPPPPPPPPPSPPPPSTSERSVINNEASSVIPTSQLQAQLREIETLRRDMAVLRQLQRDMCEGTDAVVEELKEKSEQLRKQEAESKDKQPTRSAARLFIEEGKEKLLLDSDKITERLEELQDTVDQLKLDVTQRKSRPSDAQMTHCQRERDLVSNEIEEFSNYIQNVKPRWKKTWEQELQTIVKEQQMLKEQEGLLLDMRDDLTALVEVYQQLEKICAYQKKAKPVLREFHVAPAEEGFEGMSSVLKQVATIDVDHQRRLKALESAEKMRQIEMDNRIDEFEQELTSFVETRKLKKTGGAEEIERIRQQKNQEMLRRMFMERSQQEAAAPVQEADE